VVGTRVGWRGPSFLLLRRKPKHDDDEHNIYYNLARGSKSDYDLRSYSRVAEFGAYLCSVAC